MFLTNICAMHLVYFLLEGLPLVYAHQSSELPFEKSYVGKEKVGLVSVEGGIYSLFRALHCAESASPAPLYFLMGNILYLYYIYLIQFYHVYASISQ